MRKIFLLLLAVSFSAAAQKTYSIKNPLILETVNPGQKSDSVLVRGSDKIVKTISRSELLQGLEGGSASDLQGVLNNGNQATDIDDLLIQGANGMIKIDSTGVSIGSILGNVLWGDTILNGNTVLKGAATTSSPFKMYDNSHLEFYNTSNQQQKLAYIGYLTGQGLYIDSQGSDKLNLRSPNTETNSGINIDAGGYGGLTMDSNGLQLQGRMYSSSLTFDSSQLLINGNSWGSILMNASNGLLISGNNGSVTLSGGTGGVKINPQGQSGKLKVFDAGIELQENGKIFFKDTENNLDSNNNVLPSRISGYSNGLLVEGIGTLFTGEVNVYGKTVISNELVANNLKALGTVVSNSFIKSGGLPTQYLMADGSVTTTSGGGGSTPTLQEVLDSGNNVTTKINVNVASGTAISAIASNDVGIRGFSSDRWGIFGSSTYDYGIYGQSVNNVGINAESINSTAFVASTGDTISDIAKFRSNATEKAVVNNDGYFVGAGFKITGGVGENVLLDDGTTIPIPSGGENPDLQSVILAGGVAELDEGNSVFTYGLDGSQVEFSAYMNDPILSKNGQLGVNKSGFYLGMNSPTLLNHISSSEGSGLKLVQENPITSNSTSLGFNEPISTANLNLASPALSGTYTLPISVNGNVADSTGNIEISVGGGAIDESNLVHKTGDEELIGIKSFSSGIKTDSNIEISGGGNIIFNTGLNTATLNTTILTADRSIDLPNKSGIVALTSDLPLIGYVAPSSATDTGVKGEIRITETYTYYCIATNTWVRSVTTTW